jgi:MATE family multidrug resistance protein
MATRAALIAEAKTSLRLLAPVLVSGVVSYSVFLINTAFVGHAGTTVLAAVAIAQTFVNITGTSLANGLMTAIDTLSAQANGAANRRRVGVLL